MPARQTRSLFVAITLCAGLLMGLATSPSIADDEATDWTLTDVDGREVTLSDNPARKTRILFFWATWCPYCKALMPHMQSIVDEYGRKELEVFAINIREDGDPKAFLEKHGYQFRLFPEGDEVAALYDIKTTPGVLIVDGNGLITFDLRNATSPREREIHKNMSHSQKAGRRAPYWAARIRRALDELESVKQAQRDVR